MDVGGESRGLNESGSGTSDVEETEGRGGRNVVTTEIQVIAPLLDLGGANRSRGDDAKGPGESRESGVVPEETAPSGERSGCVTVRVQ